MDVEAYIAGLRASPTRPTDWDERTEAVIRKLLATPTAMLLSENCRICGIGTIRVKGSRRCKGCPNQRNDNRPCRQTKPSPR